MEKINQRNLNAILLALIVIIMFIGGYRALTEQKRVDYYICYDELEETSLSHSDKVAYCKRSD